MTVRDYFENAYKIDQRINCKCQHKNVGFISYKHVVKTTCLYEIF